jgi:hypothetical protein
VHSPHAILYDFFFDERFFDDDFFVDERFFDDDFFEDDFFDEDFFDDFFFDGTLPPSRRASESPMAMACLRLFTFLPELPLFSVPCLRSCIAFSTLSCAFFPYFDAMLRSPFAASKFVQELVPHFFQDVASDRGPLSRDEGL